MSQWALALELQWPEVSGEVVRWGSGHITMTVRTVAYTGLKSPQGYPLFNLYLLGRD